MHLYLTSSGYGFAHTHDAARAARRRERHGGGVVMGADGITGNETRREGAGRDGR